MRFGFHKTALLIGAATMLTPAMASAQVNLDAAESDVRVFQGNIDGEAETYEVTVEAGTIMQIDVLSTSGLDPIVTITDAATGNIIAEDDDGGDELNSRVRIPGEDGRRIVIAVDSYDSTWVEEGETYGGTYDLRLSSSTYTAPVTRAVTYGSRETGTVMGEPSLFTFTAAAGDRIEVALLSEGTLDPFLELRDAGGDTLNTNDDGGQGLNSLLVHTFEEPGTYTIAAMGYGESTGEFTLRVRERREATGAQLPLQTIGINDQASGELASEWDSQGTTMPTSIMYMLSDEAKDAIRAGHGEVTIHMIASDEGDPDFGSSIDPFIEVGFETPLGFAVFNQDDDGSGSLDSLLPLNLNLISDEDGMLNALRIRAMGYSGSSGAYTLSITEGLEERVGWSEDEMMIPPPVSIAPAPSN